MSRETFENTGVFYGIECMYEGEKYLIKSVDFQEGLIAFLANENDKGLTWVRYENCEYTTLRSPMDSN